MVLRTNSTLLYDRLVSRYGHQSKSLFLGANICSRGYSEKKLQENIDSEIMEVLLEEARSSYDAEIVIELQSDSVEDIENNVERMETWIQNWETNVSSNVT